MPTASSHRATLAKPIIEVTMRHFGTGAGHLLKHYNRPASAMVEKGVAMRQGNTLKIPLKKGSGGRAGHGYALRLNGRTANEHIEITTNGHLNFGSDFTLNDSKYEATFNQVKDTDAVYAGEAFAREFVNNYLDELSYGHNYVPFNPASTATSFTSVITLMKKQGMMMRMGGGNQKMNIVTSNNMWQAIHNQRHTNVTNELMSVNEKMFNFVPEVDSIPTYKTGDRAGLCLKVYSVCQSGCKLYISGGSDAAGRLIVRKGEVLEISGVKALDEHTHRTQGYNRQFVSTCDVWADSAGKAEVSIDPELLPLKEDYSVSNALGQTATNGGRKNVDFHPKDGAAITVSRGLQPNSEYEQSLIWYDDAMIKVAADLAVNKNHFKHMQMKRRVKQGGNSIVTENYSKIYMSEDFDINEGRSILRWDTSLDYINAMPELVTRLVGIKVGDL